MSDSRDEIRVKVLFKSSFANRKGGWEAQFPGQKPVWGRCRFILTRLKAHTIGWL